MSTRENTVEAVNKVLGEPVFAEFTDNAWKIRTNLILASVVSIAVVFANLHIEPDSQILGLKFKGLDDIVLTNGLIAVVAYLLAHFLWSSLDTIFEWRLRITGTKVAFVTTARLASEHGDYPSNPRQSTLYNWWKNEARKMESMSSRPAEIDAKLLEWEAQLKARFAEGANAMNIANATMSISDVRQDLAALKRSIEETSKAIAAARIPASLERFDAWYGLFLRSQNLRWLLIDFLAPVMTGSYALILLLNR